MRGDRNVEAARQGLQAHKQETSPCELSENERRRANRNRDLALTKRRLLTEIWQDGEYF